MGKRRRYRLIDLDRLCWRLGSSNPRKAQEVSLGERIVKDQVERQILWTESLVVGSAAFVDEFKPQIQSRRRIQVEESGENLWVLKETEAPYTLETMPKINSKPHLIP